MSDKMGGVITRPMSREEALEILAIKVEENKTNEPLNHEEIL